MKNTNRADKKRAVSITLIGMAGAGKSVIGRRLAEVLRYPFIDVDEQIEQRFGQKLQEIVDRLGEERFLHVEEQAILALGPLHQTVISPGGSAVYSKKGMAFLKKHSVVVFLDAPFELIAKQISNLDSRGIVWQKKSSLKLLFQGRKPLYEKYADVTVRLSARSKIDATVEKILRETELSDH